MNKTYFFTALLLIGGITGCLELDDTAEDKSSSLEDAFNGFIDSINAENWRKYCQYMEYTVDEENNTIIIANNTELDECADLLEELYSDERDDNEYRLTTSNYIEKNLDFRAANNSGFVYSMNATIEDCKREDEFEPWACGEYELRAEWVKVNGQWIWWHSERNVVGCQANPYCSDREP